MSPAGWFGPEARYTTVEGWMDAATFVNVVWATGFVILPRGSAS
jgi:hypothetical protein